MLGKGVKVEVGVMAVDGGVGGIGKKGWGKSQALFDSLGGFESAETRRDDPSLRLFKKR